MTTRLNALETAYVDVERPEAPLHVASVGFFEAAPFFDDDGVFKLAEVRAAVLARIGLLPRLRQRLMKVPFEVGRPVWVDDADFDIANHVAVTAIPAPGDAATVNALITQRYGELLDRAHPLWHMMFFTGAADGRVVLLQRVHHAVADGIGGVGLATVLLDLERHPKPVTYPALPDPEPTPGLLALARDAVRDRTEEAMRLLGTAAGTALLHPLHLARRLNENVEALTAGSESVLAPRSSLNAPVGHERRLVFVREQLDDFKQLGDRYGATVNDVVLTVVTNGLRALLLDRGERLDPDAVVKTLVPVSFRPKGDSAALGNEVAGLVVPLPIGIGDPVVRITTVVKTMQAIKASGEEAATVTLLDGADLLPPVLLHAAHAVLVHQPLVNLVVTNVPGPPFPLYAYGAELLEAFPIVPLAGNLTLGVAVLSYSGALNFGVTVDPTLCPDVDVFVAGMRAALDALRG